jgi:hypothetical protein
MMWQYTRRETKFLLLATLFVFSGFGLMVSKDVDVRLMSTPARITASTVGVVASVPQNPTGTLAAQLEAKEQELALREATLARAGQADTRTLAIVGGMGAGLLSLILLNFYLDTKRRHSLV